MDFVKLQKLVKLAHNLDLNGEYKKADKVFVKLSQYYPEQSVTKVENVKQVDFSEDSVLQNEIDENWTNYFDKHPPLVVKETKGRPAAKDDMSQEAQMHGSQTDGAAAYDPGNPASSPSMQNDLSRFEWDNIRDENHPEYDRIPVR
jgi:hypothetical protein